MKNLKTILCVLISVLMIMGTLFLSVTVQANDSTAPTVTVESKTVEPGEEFAVNVDIVNTSSIYSGSFVLNYDSNKLEVLVYKKAEILGNYMDNCNLDYQSAGNKVYFNFFGNYAMTGEGTMVTFTFKAKADAKGDAELRVSNLKMYDGSGVSLNPVAINGVVSIVTATSEVTTNPPATTTAPPTTTTAPPVTSTATDPKETTTAPPTTTTAPPVTSTATDPKETTTAPPATTTAPPVTSTSTDPRETTYETVATVTEISTAESITTVGHEEMVLMGDADLSEKITVKDATLIQKNVAGLSELSEKAMFASNVISTDNLNVKDATAIQKWLASLPINVKINEFVPYEEDTPSEPVTTTVAEDVAVISCGGETFTAKVGDTITYSVLLEAEKKFENIQGNVYFDSTVLSLLSNDSEHCPNLPYAMVNQDSDDSILFLATDGYSTGFDFRSEKLLFTYSFVVRSAEETELDLVIDTMTIVGGDDYYFDCGEAVVTDGITIKELVTVV